MHYQAILSQLDVGRSLQALLLNIVPYKLPSICADWLEGSVILMKLVIDNVN